MSEQPIISVIIPVFGAQRYIRRTIEALLDQDYASCYEILMIDNNSLDLSAAIIGEYPEITLLRQPQPGSYAARNVGIQKARGEILVFTDPDCVPSRDWLSRIYASMRDPTIGILLGHSHSVISSLGLQLLDAYEVHKDAFAFATTDPSLYWGRTNNMAVRASLMRQHGPFVELHRGADSLFVQQVVQCVSCDVVRYSPELRVTHLEMSGITIYWFKVCLYGRSFMRSNQIIPSRSLTYSERLHVFRRTVRSMHYGLLKSTYLSFLLMLGMCFWILGASMGRLDVFRSQRKASRASTGTARR
jgi:glycosyltransferase involved in cell wall biosynthesis